MNLTEQAKEIVSRQELGVQPLWYVYSLLRWWDRQIEIKIWDSQLADPANSRTTLVALSETIQGASPMFTTEAGGSRRPWTASCLLDSVDGLPQNEWLEHIMSLDFDLRQSIANTLRTVAIMYQNDYRHIPAWMSVVATLNVARHISETEVFTGEEIGMMWASHMEFVRMGMTSLFWDSRCLVHLSTLYTDASLLQAMAINQDSRKRRAEKWG